MILGDRIDLLVGGGCDAFTEYVELLVDGYSVARATGKCQERMFPIVSFILIRMTSPQVVCLCGYTHIYTLPLSTREMCLNASESKPEHLYV